MAVFSFICGIILLPGNMKKFLTVTTACCFFLAGCFKDSVHNNADSTAVTAIFNGGTDNLAAVPLGLAGSDSATFYINAGITSPFTLDKDVTITLEVNDAARVAYNASHTIQYQALPDSLYSFTTTSAVITAGARSINLPIVIYAPKADLTKNYMLPITIKDAQGLAISGDLGTIYYNSLGSAIAGRYAVTGTRTDYNGPVSGGSIARVTDLSTIGAKTTITVTPDVVNMDYSDLGSAGWQYQITFDAGTKQVTISPNNVMTNSETGVYNNSFKIDIQDYNPTTKALHFKTEYKDLSGNARVVEEFLKPQ